MSKVKIISNPYKKETIFQKWSVDNQEWIAINSVNNKKSNLPKVEFKEGFFPFKVNKIVECLAEEYSSSERIEVYFEGSDDEFKELEEVCADETFGGKIIPCKSEIELANARDILPAVRKLFQEMSPLILQSVSREKIERDLNRFTDASSDVVPICVFGNYSEGKSTFINALIGSEILPSGTEPVTAKVYKISRSKFKDRAYVKFIFAGYQIEIQFTETDTVFNSGISESEITSLIKEAVSEVEAESISIRVNRILSVINEYESKCEIPRISDLIEVNIPFSNGVLAETQHPFVIFDTPGSNSASNERHLKVLKEAMANMTNGLPIFLSTPVSLDSKDNANLYKIIKGMEELDNRFTMIVVNKTDTITLQSRGTTSMEQKKVLGQTVPRNLYSGGIFYVSSILGLGAKTKGNLLDLNYEDIYDAQKNRYRDPENRHYRSLYMINIMPAQIKKRADSAAREQENLIYANSGLFTVEKEIEVFAGKYSAYNKCSQSKKFLLGVIQTTAESIDEKKIENEGIRQSIRDKLETDKKELIDKLGLKAEEQRDLFVDGYSGFMFEYLGAAEDYFSIKDLKEQEGIFTQEHEKELELEKKSEEVSRARATMADNLKHNIANAFKELNASALKNIVDDFQADYESSHDLSLARRETRHQVDKQAADSLLQYVSEKYDHKLVEVYDLLDQQSRRYWTTNTERLREDLAKIVSGSEVLTDDRRKELERIIITYQPLSFQEDSADRIFDKVNFERRFRIGKITLWESDHLNIEKLARTYNTNISLGANTRYRSIEESHRVSAFNWIQNLLDEINENIVQYSPELSKQARQIRIMTEHIEELEQRKIRLEEYKNELQEMMDWHYSE